MNPINSTSAISLFSEWAADRSFAEKLTARQKVVRAFVDTVGCMIAGLDLPEVRQARSAMLSFASLGATALPGTQAFPPIAALLNATAAHALDFDDHEILGLTHPSAVLVPALLAVGEAQQCKGSALIDAYIVGYEFVAYAGAILNPSHYKIGWHATGTIGSVAAAAACAHLLHLDGKRIGHAISLACSMAGGMRSQFGTTAKPLQAGLAAQAGVAAAYLAAEGMTASLDALDGPFGLRSLMSPSPPNRKKGVPLGSGSLAIERQGPIVKRFPACAATHRTLDSVLELITAHNLKPLDILRVETELPDIAASALKFTNPTDGMQARFSMQYCVSVVIEAGSLKLSDFSRTALEQPAIRARMPTVSLSSYAVADNPFKRGAYRVQTLLILNDGRVLDDTRFHSRGAPECPLDKDAFRAKFDDCLSAADQFHNPAQAFDKLHMLEAAEDVAELVAWISKGLKSG